jgi:hypothetical protein
MLLSTSLAVSLAVLSAGPEAPQPPSCEPAFTSRLPSLAPVFTAAERFRQAARDGKTSFTDLVKQGAKLEAQAAETLDQIQSAGCELNAGDTQRFDACISPIQWSCEGVPPSIDWKVLKDVPKSEDEALAYALTLPEGGAGVDLLSEKVSFAGGCGDFGCAPNSIALPWALNEPEKVDQLVTLATRPGFFGQRALQSLEGMGRTLAKATCELDGWRPSPKEQKALVEHLEARRSDLTGKGAQATRVRQALHRLAAALKRGLPKKECERPGY